MRTRTGRHRLAVLAVYLLLVIATLVLLGTRFVPAHELSFPTGTSGASADAEGY